MKFLLWAVIGFAVVKWLFRTKQTAAQKDAVQQDNAERVRCDGVETMVQCVHCGVHIPQSEAIIGRSGTVFCSEEHRLLHVTS